MISNIEPYESWEKDGTTITVVKQFPYDWPDEHLQLEYKHIKREFGAVLLEAIERTNSKVVIEYEEQFPKQGEWIKNPVYGFRSGFIITARIRPVKYWDVRYAPTQYVEPSWWIKTKPKTFREKLSKWISGK